MHLTTNFAILAICAISKLLISEGKIFDKCEFARTLRRLGMPDCQISTWVCIANYESHFDTAARNMQSGDHGIFQISELYWCSTTNTPGGGCNARCADFRDDDIRDDVECVKKIFREHQRLSGNGFNAWTTFPVYCSGDNSRWVRDCPGFGRTEM